MKDHVDIQIDNHTLVISGWDENLTFIHELEAPQVTIRVRKYFQSNIISQLLEKDVTKILVLELDEIGFGSIASVSITPEDGVQITYTIERITT
ncbi:MAG: hypothetical protein NC548_06160 [Lachnospiraceae bacterium]|nr:hypothetical protein [Lachnospiraceae bacterium]